MYVAAAASSEIVIKASGENADGIEKWRQWHEKINNNSVT
jgi:hypothetical protein